MRPGPEDQQGAPDERSLQDGLIGWCDPNLRVTFLSARRNYGEFRRGIEIELDTSFPRSEPFAAGLRDLWNDQEQRLHSDIDRAAEALVNDLRSRLERRELFLHGYRLIDEECPTRFQLPGHRAIDFVFVIGRGSVTIGDERYTGVLVSREILAPLAPKAAPSPPQQSVVALGDVATMADDVLMELLEEHGRRVVSNLEHPLIQPSKVSFGPILARRMEWRAKNGQLASTFAAECVALVEWLATKIVHHQIPTARGIHDPLRDLYRELKAESTTRIA
jgi:hypothetical protein